MRAKKQVRPKQRKQSKSEQTKPRMKTNTSRKSSKKKKQQIKIRAIKQKKRNQLIREVFLGLCLITLFVYGQSFFFFSIAKVNSYAMSPNLKFGTYVLIEKKQKIQRQDIVLIKRENTQKIEMKRIIGLPNEKVVYKNDQLFINDEEREEPFITAEKEVSSENEFMYTKDFTLVELTGEATVSKDCFFVLGDNRIYSTDSREYGLIKRKEIIGVISLR